MGGYWPLCFLTYRYSKYPDSSKRDEREGSERSQKELGGIVRNEEKGAKARSEDHLWRRRGRYVGGMRDLIFIAIVNLAL